MRTVSRFFAVVAVVCACVAVRPAVVAARQQPLPSSPTFRSGVNLVTVDVIVRNKKTGRLVTGLTKRDFRIYDEGTLQKISGFASIDLPDTREVATRGAAARRRAVAALDHLATNQHPEGRVIAFFIDDSAISPEATGYLRDWLLRYVHHHMAINDQVAIWTVTDMLPRQGFTSDRTRLDAMIARIQGTRDSLPFVPSLGYRLMVFRHLLENLDRIPDRRKVVIWLGNIWRPGLGRPFALAKSPVFAYLIKEAAAANVAVYPVNVTGVGGFSDVVTGGPDVPLQSANQPLPIVLQELAQDTGGFLADRNNFGKVLQQIEDEAGSYYLLGFTPSTIDPKPNNFRRLRVEVDRRGLTVRARRDYVQLSTFHGYQAELSARPIGNVAAGPIPIRTMPLRIQAASFRGRHGRDTVLVTVRTTAPAARLAGQAIQYALVGLDDHGKMVDETQGVPTIPRVTAGLPGIMVVSALHVKPGLCTIKAALRTQKGLVGSVFLNLDVPKLTGRLALSDIELTSLGEHRLVLGKPPAFIKEQLPDPPVAGRTFAPDDILAFYGQLYRRTGTGLVGAEATVQSSGGRVERHVHLALRPIAPASRSARLSYVSQVSLAGLPAGTYTLAVKALDRHVGQRTARVAFTVR